jgi:trk system potassium uptake protein TrkH
MGFVVFVNGLVLIAAGLGMAAMFALYPDTREVFLASSFAVSLLGTLLCLSSRPRMSGSQRLHGFLLTCSVWLTAAVASALPLWLWRLSPADAFFESMSAITTTGSTVITGLDTTERGILMWRAVLQLAGGVGFIVTGMALLPILRVGGMQLFRTESSERGDKELASAARFAAATLWVYLSLTALCAAVYAIGGMTAFEAVSHAFTTLSTGGYSTSDASFGHFTSPFLHWAGALFMLAGALPFAWYIRLATRGRVASEQVRALTIGLVAVIAALTVWRIASSDAAPFTALTEVTFNVISVVTTTGFATTDYTLWGAPAVVAFFVLTAFGGCTGSTSGGMKAMRWIILGRFFAARLRKIHAPSAVIALRYENRAVEPDQIAGVIAFFSVFFLTFTMLSVALALVGLDFETAVSGALTALCNVGPGVGATIGPAGNFSTLPDAAKWILSLGMYLGRLEMLTVFVLFTPAFWREFA